VSFHKQKNPQMI